MSIPAAVFPLGDRPFERRVADRVVLDLHGQPLRGRVERRLLRHGPALEDAVGFQAEVVVEVRGVVLLDDEDREAGVRLGALALGLSGFGEVAPGLVLVEGHGVRSSVAGGPVGG